MIAQNDSHKNNLKQLKNSKSKKKIIPARKSKKKSHKLISHFPFKKIEKIATQIEANEKNGAVIAFIDSCDKLSKVTKQLPGCPNSIG